MAAREHQAHIHTRTRCVSARRSKGLWHLHLERSDGSLFSLRARALVKGWLFYPAGAVPAPLMDGIGPAHCRERAHDVGGKQPNAWGLYDMLGNIWEWCWDTYDPKVYGDYRVLRGGGWFDEHWSCRASVRRRSHPTYRIDDVGFRVARSVATPTAR